MKIALSDTSKEGDIREVKRFAWLPKIVGKGENRYLIWFRSYWCVYQCMEFSMKTTWILVATYADE